MRQRVSQSYHIFDSSLTRVKGTVKVISIFDLAFDKNQMCDKSNFSCRELSSAPAFASNFYMSAKRKTRSPLQTGVSISPADKKKREITRKRAPARVILYSMLLIWPRMSLRS